MSNAGTKQTDRRAMSGSDPPWSTRASHQNESTIHPAAAADLPRLASAACRWNGANSSQRRPCAGYPRPPACRLARSRTSSLTLSRARSLSTRGGPSCDALQAPVSQPARVPTQRSGPQSCTHPEASTSEVGVAGGVSSRTDTPQAGRLAVWRACCGGLPISPLPDSQPQSEKILRACASSEASERGDEGKEGRGEDNRRPVQCNTIEVDAEPFRYELPLWMVENERTEV
jgi:hypothetical protein